VWGAVWFFEVVVDSGRSVTTTSSMLAAVSVSGAINSSLGKVIISKRACLSEVVVRAACTLTTSSIFVGFWGKGNA